MNSIHFATSRHSGGQFVNLYLTKGTPSREKPFIAFQNSLKLSLLGEEEALLRELAQQRWYCPTVAWLRQNPATNEAMLVDKMGIPQPEGYPVNSFVFVYLGVKDDIDKEIKTLVQILTTTLRKRDKGNPNIKFSPPYAEWSKVCDISRQVAGYPFEPLDHVIGDSYVAECSMRILDLYPGLSDEEKQLNYGILYRKANEPKLFSPRGERGYAYVPIAEFGYPACQETRIGTIEGRLQLLSDNFKLILNSHLVERFAVDYFKSLSIDFLPHLNPEYWTERATKLIEDFFLSAETIFDVPDTYSSALEMCRLEYERLQPNGTHTSEDVPYPVAVDNFDALADNTLGVTIASEHSAVPLVAGGLNVSGTKRKKKRSRNE